MALHTVPLELLSNIACFLSSSDPYSPPQDLLALQATSRYFNEALNCHLNPAVWAAAFRFRFDDQAVLRRNYRPSGRDYYDQLRQYTEALAAVRKQNVAEWTIDEEDLPRTIYVMLLDNNGKNRAQLEKAGIDGLLMNYLEVQFWADAERNDGWPEDNQWNVFVLWSMWMLTTPEKLGQETIERREATVLWLLPHALNPYRYHQAEAPPSHFHLPLPSDHERGTIVIPISIPSAHGPYPVYVQPSREVSLPYFGSMPLFSPPPITTAAKLLYFARREIIPFNIPPHLPRTRAEAPPSNEPRPTQEDFIEINAHRGAEPPPCITWDWDQGCRLINGIRDDSDFDHSTRWDPDYWRRRLCGYAWRSEPKWRPGNVYVPGSMDGLWQGRLVFPAEDAMTNLMANTVYPGQQRFNETALTLTHQPLFMRLKEYHAVSTSSSFPVHAPFPPPNPSSSPLNNDDSTDWSDLSMRNAWFPGFPGNVQFMTHSHPPRNSLLYTEPGEPKNVIVKLEGHTPAPHVPKSPFITEQNAWVYKEFDRRVEKELKKLAETQGVEYGHQGQDNCETCREREDALRKGQLWDEHDHDRIANAYAEDWRTIDQLFESVGLGRDEMNPESDLDMDVDDDDEAGGGGGDEESPEFIRDDNADIPDPRSRPIRRGTDRSKIKQCDGIQDIVFNGTTDRRHALAWNDFTFYGRVRPWDGLIGILRRSYWPRQNFIFFYGYLIGSNTFVGNWRFAAMDPTVPTWESAFVMSRRNDEDEGDDDETEEEESPQR